MKSIIVFFLLFVTTATFAADLFVQEFGGGGTFSTISDAITASVSGDRILVQPKAGNAPYIENLTINKELQILTASNGNRFFLQGNISIATSLAAGNTVVIDGVNITTGTISQTTASTNAVNVFVVNSVLQSGNVRFGQRFNATIANNTITTPTSSTTEAVSACKGNILGNVISAFERGITYSTDASATNDTFYILGNRVTLTGNFANNTISGINWGNNSYFHFIANNYVFQSNTNYNGTTGTISYTLIIISGFKAGANSNQINTLMNNTVAFSVTTGVSSVTFNGISGSLDNRCQVLSNLVQFLTSAVNRVGFSVASGPQFSYNNVSTGSTFNSGTATDPTNTTTAVTINTSSGCITNNPDLGHPNAIFTDLDLTRNDWGACGGSFNISQNFLNSSTPGTAKVHLLLAPRRVLQGGTISIEAEGHDR